MKIKMNVEARDGGYVVESSIDGGSAGEFLAGTHSLAGAFGRLCRQLGKKNKGIIKALCGAMKRGVLNSKPISDTSVIVDAGKIREARDGKL